MLDKIRQTLSLFLVVLLILSTTGCWNRREIQTLTITTAIGFDKVTTAGKPQYLLSALTVKPSPAGGAGAGGAGVGAGAGGAARPGAGPGHVISVTGETPGDATRNWDLRSSRQLFMAHIQVFVIGEDLAKEGIGWIIDFANRNRDVPLRSWVVICKGTAQDALQAQPEFEQLLSTEISNILVKNRFFVARTEGENIVQVIYDLLTPGREVVVSQLKTFIPPETGSPIRQGSTKTPANKVISLSGSAAFRGDRLAGYLNEVETQGMLFIKNQAKGGIIPVGFKSPQKKGSYIFRDIRTKIKPVIKKEGIIFEIKVSGTGELTGELPGYLDLTKKEDVKTMEEQVSREAELRCRNAVARAQELRSDIFGFGDLIHRDYPSVWKQIQHRWDDFFPAVKVKIRADFTVEHPGLTSKPLEIK